MEPFNAGWLSLLPPAAAIVAALISREVISALLVGILTGAVIYTSSTGGGVIIGSWMDAGYYDYDLGYVSLEVYENGAPRLYWHQERRNQPNGGVQSVVFSLSLIHISEPTRP